jgi:hypothetical protein
MERFEDELSIYAFSNIRFGNISSELIRLIDQEIVNAIKYEEEDLNKLPTSDYRSLILDAQNRLNELGVNELIYKEIRKDFAGWYPDAGGYLVQSNVYLRASRPIVKQQYEHIGWHRESFYGSGMEKAHNVWVPIRGVNEKNTLRYIPESHHIPTDELEIYSVDDPITTRFSNGHKLGFLYSPKIIKSGIDFSSAKPINVPKNCFACFPAELIHGAAVNRSKTIRFSVDLRIINKSDYKNKVSKSYHFASGRSYFVDMEK